MMNNHISSSDKMGTIVEDGVEYEIYHINSSNTEPLPTFQREVVERLQQILCELNRDRPYLWHKEPFQFEAIPSQLSLLLCGKTVFGDGVEDEWVIVYILYTLSKQFQDIVISIKDSDGQFLLIDIADHLPKWVTPEVMEHRVFIRNGELILVDIKKDQEIPLTEALDHLKNNHRFEPLTVAAQKQFQNRVNQYPSRAREHQNFAYCILPEIVAKIITTDPSLVAPAIEAYYLRDPSDIKACYAMKKFSPSKSVLKNVYFTRTLYSQLAFQPLISPIPTSFIDSKAYFNLSHFDILTNMDEVKQASELGIKLACGFEILSSRINNTSGSFKQDARYNLFLNHLISEGFFCGELEGSTKYKELEKKAQTQYLLSKSQPEYTPEKKIEDILSRDLSLSPIKNTWEEKQSSKLDWLDMSPDDLQKILESQMMKDLDPNDLEDTEDQNVTEELNRLINNVSLFVNQESELEGTEMIHDVIFPTEEDSDEDFIELDPESFFNNVKNLLNFAPETLELKNYEHQMEAELHDTKVPMQKDPNEEGYDSDASLDLDVHLVSNFLSSQQANSGFGPTSSFFPSS